MAENSILWTTNGTGDGASNYTQAELIRWMRQTFIGDNTDEGVLKNYQNELEVTDAGGTQVDIDTGGAYVYGFPYWNTASVSKTLDTPSSDTRIDRIVLQADWTAQTVRIAVIEGSEGGGAPALTQTDGTKWEISLAQVAVTTGGDIQSLTDERVFVHPNIEVEYAMLNSALQLKSLFAPVTRVSNNSFYSWNGRPGVSIVSGEDANIAFDVPPDFSSIHSADILVVPGINANASWDIDLSVVYSAVDEANNTHTDSDTASTYDFSTDDDKLKAIDISGLLGSLAAGDNVGVEIENNETDGLTVIGVRFQYT